LSEQSDLPGHPATSDDALFDNLIAASAETPTELPVREGLPPTYQMRHDAHYVDELEARARRFAEVTRDHQPHAPRTPPATAPSAPILPAVEELCQNLGGLSSCLGLLETPRSLRERLGLELARVEARRIARGLQFLRILLSDVRPTVVELDLLELLAHVLDELKEELRLARIEVALDVIDGVLVVRGDRKLLSTALFGGVGALVTVLETAASPQVLRVTAKPWSDVQVRLDCALDGALLPPGTRLFEMDGSHRPGGASVALALQAARRIARLHGGNLEISGTDEVGTRLSLTLPIAQK